MTETHLGSKKIADLIEVVVGEKDPTAQLSQESHVGGFIVQREDALNIFPLAPSWRDPGSAIVLGPVYQMVHGKDVLGLKCTVDNSVFDSPGMALDNAVQPVLDSGSVSAGPQAKRKRGNGRTENCRRSFPGYSAAP
jgi:hypothetical protein